MTMQHSHIREFGPWRLDAAQHLLFQHGAHVPLQPKAFEILLALVERPGEVVSKEELMERVWPDTFIEEINLTKNISVLRKTLANGEDIQDYIQTIPKRGYRFVAELSEPPMVAEPDAPQTEETSLAQVAPGPPPSTGAAAASAAHQSVQSAWNRRALLTALVVIGVVLSALLYGRRTPTAQPDQIKSLAVLPLENLSGDASQEYFADGMTDALISDLAKIGALRVISRTSVMTYKGTKKSLPQIASELQVDAVVEGSVLRSGDRILVRTKLIHAADERHLWGESYERDLRDVLKLQSEVARAITREIQAKVTPAEQTRLSQSRRVNRKAYDDYLQGRYLYWNKRTKVNLEKALEYFQSAIQEDPTYALAYAGLADCYNSLGSVMYSGLSPGEARQRAVAAASKALEYDSQLAEAHAARGYANHYNWNWDESAREFKRAIELNPNYANAHGHYANYLVSRGYSEEAIAEADRSLELDPLSLDIGVNRGWVLFLAHRYPEAVEQLRRVITMDANQYSAHWFLSQTYAANGQVEEAIASAEKAVALSDRAPGALAILGRSYAWAGRKDEANKVLNELLERNRRHYVTPSAVAGVYIGLGEKDQAFLWLEKCFQERTNNMAYLKVLPALDPLRSDPRFDDLLRRIGLAQ